MQNSFGRNLLRIVTILAIFHCCLGHYDVKCSPNGKNDFNRKVRDAGDKLVAAEFMGTQCPQSKAIEPKVMELEKKYEDKAVVLMVDVEKCPKLSMENNITATPTFMFIKNNKNCGIVMGNNPEALEEMFEKNTE